MRKIDTYGTPYMGRTLSQEIMIRMGGFAKNLPSYVPLAVTLTIFTLAYVLG